MNACPLCRGPTTIFWLHDAIWEAVIAANSSATELTCIHCAEKAIGRPLTLRDLSIKNFARTAKNMTSQPGVIRDYVRAFVAGACKASNNAGYWPDSWTYTTSVLNNTGEGIGAHLAKNTLNICPVLDELIRDASEFVG